MAYCDRCGQKVTLPKSRERKKRSEVEEGVLVAVAVFGGLSVTTVAVLAVCKLTALKADWWEWTWVAAPAWIPAVLVVTMGAIGETLDRWV